MTKNLQSVFSYIAIFAFLYLLDIFFLILSAKSQNKVPSHCRFIFCAFHLPIVYHNKLLRGKFQKKFITFKLCSEWQCHFTPALVDVNHCLVYGIQAVCTSHLLVTYCISSQLYLHWNNPYLQLPPKTTCDSGNLDVPTWSCKVSASFMWEDENFYLIREESKTVILLRTDDKKQITSLWNLF